ncbi:hypothetical protein GS928_19060 [Rhodococcus hoagii]|nr:hypothetical protein [Prescottella equi]
MLDTEPIRGEHLLVLRGRRVVRQRSLTAADAVADGRELLRPGAVPRIRGRVLDPVAALLDVEHDDLVATAARLDHNPIAGHQTLHRLVGGRRDCGELGEPPDHFALATELLVEAGGRELFLGWDHAADREVPPDVHRWTV